MYFTPGWSSEDGGSLDLFSVDKNGCPADVKCRLVPSFNSVRKSDAACISYTCSLSFDFDHFAIFLFELKSIVEL